MNDIPISFLLVAFAGLLAVIHTGWSEYTGRISTHSYYLRTTPAAALTTLPMLYIIATDPAAHPVIYGVALVAALLCANGARQAYRTRPLPPWYGGAHERIDNP